MQAPEIVVGLDIGTTKIACLVGQRNENGKLEILGMGQSDSIGVIRGVVSNIENTVNSIKEAVEHINNFSSGHTESIITNNSNTFKIFYNKINSAIILQNASTQFADGGEFGFGAEIGISTDKLHVRGPVGSEHLTSFKYVVHGNGQIRS